mmetsp:Transcript_34226/g.72931  ORF Transcript_34226/g.72931 Transcript_34226/m.72931 type:complete len:264 (-) Transcript_34226:37-828(-)
MYQVLHADQPGVAQLALDHVVVRQGRPFPLHPAETSPTHQVRDRLGAGDSVEDVRLHQMEHLAGHGVVREEDALLHAPEAEGGEGPPHGLGRRVDRGPDEDHKNGGGADRVGLVGYFVQPTASLLLVRGFVDGPALLPAPLLVLPLRRQVVLVHLRPPLAVPDLPPLYAPVARPLLHPLLAHAIVPPRGVLTMAGLDEYRLRLDYLHDFGLVAHALPGDRAGEGLGRSTGAEVVEVVSTLKEGLGDQLEVGVGVHGGVIISGG